jgi:hypothetical protein
MSKYEELGEQATKILVKSAEIWPKAIGMQQEFAHVVRKYQIDKQTGKEVGEWFS